ncbi:SusC/RagA family TonB-linked outer membrane protein [Chitinophaga sp. RAB17]|uniref:SusC/RagA family TonB-linked outer membrane protein n=1 Tax=Chitinophaga sp. RAB17 TaxID=3233049 RepID=UPI003F91B4D7
MKMSFKSAHLFLSLLCCLLLFAATGWTQVLIKGKVVGTDNQGIPGVSIAVKGQSSGVVSTANGSYSITANATQDTLLFRMMGYMPVSRVIGHNTTINVQLVATLTDINEVVVMGYDDKKRNEITSAVSVLSGKRLKDVTANDIGTMLQGKVAGVQVVNSSGAPGSQPDIRIRGIASLSAPKGPLVVVDGIIGGNYDPGDVASVTILKDAGATGMYGSQANGGVIIITTKKGKPGAPRFDFKTTLGRREVNKGHLNMMSGSEFFNASKELYRDTLSGKIDILKFYNERPRDLATRNFDWVGNAFHPAMVQSYYLSASGKTDKFTYYLGGSYYKEAGTFKNTGFQRVNLRSNTTYEFSKRVSVSNNINISASTGKSYDYMDLFYSYLSLPWDNPYDSLGSPRYVDARTPGWWSRDKINPLHTLANSDHSTKDFNINYDFIGNVKITDWLTFTSSNRVGVGTNKSHSFFSPLVAGSYHDKGFLDESSSLYYSGISTNLLKFSVSKGLHSISGLAGVEFQGSWDELLGGQGKGLPVGFDVPGVISSEQQLRGVRNHSVMQSLISQVNYNYAEKYYLTASYRIDGTSAFPPTNRYAQFPAVGVSWLASNETFLKGNPWLNLLKLRATYGITGMQDIGAYKYLGLFSLSAQYNSQAAAIPYQLPNDKLTWEKTHQRNIGLDLGLWNRITLNVDVYSNVTKDLLLQVSQPLSVGFESRWENVGQLRNKGLEITLSTVNVKTKNFQWGMDFTFGMNKNELAGIGKPVYQTINGITQIYRDGGELYTFNIPKWLGVDPATGRPLWESISKDDAGNIVKRTPTSDYSQAQSQETGHALPRFQGGFGTNFSWKGISLSASFAYSQGAQIMNFIRRFMDVDGHEPYYNQMQPKSDWSRWTKPGDMATHPSMQKAALSTEISSRYQEDGSFIKLRNISLSYDVPMSIVQRLHLQGLRLALSGDNLYTWTKFWGQDPEVTVNRADFSMPGVADFRYPANRQYLGTIEINF